MTRVDAITRSFGNLLVIVTIITTLTGIATILPYAAVHWRISFAGSVLVGLLGTVAMYYEVRRLYRIEMLKSKLDQLLVSGSQITHSINQRTMEEHESIRDWCAQVDAVLREYLNESYVARFHQGGSITQGPAAMTIWKNNHRLETLSVIRSEF